jgi:hypothetical protein
MNPTILLCSLVLLVASGSCHQPRAADGAVLRFQRMGLLAEGHGLNANTFSVVDDTVVAANDSVAWMARLHPLTRGQGALTRLAAFAVPTQPILRGWRRGTCWTRARAAWSTRSRQRPLATTRRPPWGTRYSLGPCVAGCRRWTYRAGRAVRIRYSQVTTWGLPCCVTRVLCGSAARKDECMA